MAFDRDFDRRRRTAAHLQQQATPTDTRQQQQDNGTHEFQPLQQHAGWEHHDDWHTLSAYLQRSETPRRHGMPLPRAELRLAK